jgi:hypothetical protein
LLVKKVFIRLIRRKEPKLNPKEIVESLRRLDVRIESVTPLPGSARQGKSSPKAPRAKVQQKRKDGKAKYDVRLSDIIAAAMLSPPLKLFRKYKGKMMEATLLPDGSVEFGETRYNSCSTAAETARSTITGRRMNTNGWVFWQFLAPDGKKLTLGDVRRAFLSKKAR